MSTFFVIAACVISAMLGALAMAVLLGSAKQNDSETYSRDTHRLDHIQENGIQVGFIEGEFGLVKDGKLLGGKDAELRRAIDAHRLTPSVFGALHKP